MICDLRQQIQDAIEQNKDNPVSAALIVCCVLEDEIGLAGNGWFDDDEDLDQALHWYFTRKNSIQKKSDAAS